VLLTLHVRFRHAERDDYTTADQITPHIISVHFRAFPAIRLIVSATDQLSPPTAPPRPWRHSALGQLVLARVREFYREPETLFWVYGFPILMVVLLGIAFRNKPVEQINLDVVAGPTADDVVRLLTAPAAGPASSGARPRQQFLPTIHPLDECRLRLRTGKTDLVVAAGASLRMRSGAGSSRAGGAPIPTPPVYEYRFDPSRPESVLARDAVDNALQRAAGRKDVAVVTDTPVDEPGGRYIDFLVPGLLGMSLMGGGLWGVGFVTVDMRIRKLLKRFLATPMRRSHFLVAIMLSRMLFMVPEVLVLLVFSWLVFGVTIHGSLLFVMVLVLLGAVMFSGIGLLIASRARTMEAVSGLMNLVMLPMWMLSGIFFSSERFPAALQPLVKALPLTPLIAALRSVMLEGTTAAALAGPVAVLVGWSVVSFVLALRWFRWT